MKLNKDLVAASAVPVVLSLLAQGESYGYALLQRVRDLSDGDLAWTDGMLYPVLHRLEEQGLVAARWGVAENGRRRRYYSLTEGGRTALADHRQQWDAVGRTLARLWGGLPWTTSTDASPPGAASLAPS